jgi:Mn2+/Fe2+ NRAMP family transporter
MNLERKLTLIYIFIGIASGFLSNLFSSLVYSIVLPVVIYLISFFLLTRFVKQKKISWLISNSLWVFVLVWLVAWIFVYNLM